MGSDREQRPGVTSDPKQPVYDNPVGKKGDLAAGNNATTDSAKRQGAGKRERRPHRMQAEAPNVPDSDKRVGQKPPVGTS